MSFLDWLWDYFRKPKPVPIDGSLVSNQDLRNILLRHTPNVWLSDAKYYTVRPDDLTKFLETNPVHKRKYLTEGQDCDDFSFELMGDMATLYSEKDHNAAFGIVWGNPAFDLSAGHAWNWFIDDSGNLKYVEPQNDEIFDPSIENIWLMIA